MNPAHLALWLDAPLQSWGFGSRFQRRTTGLFPTKSGLAGMICAALGVAKGSALERQTLQELAALHLTVWQFPRSPGHGPLSLQRLEDFHTVLETRRASGPMNPDPVITRRQYLLDARFGATFSGDPARLAPIAAALRNPHWGVWLGRKCCVPAAPVLAGGPFATQAEAWQALLRAAALPVATLPADLPRVEEVAEFAAGTDTLNDQPVSFGATASSGVEGREFAPRRVRAFHPPACPVVGPPAGGQDAPV